MTENPPRRPFSDALRRLRITQNEMASRSRVRTQPWYSKLLREGAWPDNGQRATDPPGPREWPGLARLLRVNEYQVRAMLADEWFGIEVVDERLRPALAQLRQLDDTRPAALVTILTPPSAEGGLHLAS